MPHAFPAPCRPPSPERSRQRHRPRAGWRVGWEGGGGGGRRLPSQTCSRPTSCGSATFRRSSRRSRRWPSSRRTTYALGSSSCAAARMARIAALAIACLSRLCHVPPCRCQHTRQFFFQQRPSRARSSRVGHLVGHLVLVCHVSAHPYRAHSGRRSPSASPTSRAPGSPTRCWSCRTTASGRTGSSCSSSAPAIHVSFRSSILVRLESVVQTHLYRSPMVREARGGHLVKLASVIWTDSTQSRPSKHARIGHSESAIQSRSRWHTLHPVIRPSRHTRISS